jgi:hypothetical protein
MGPRGRDEMIVQAVFHRALHHGHVLMIHGDTCRLRENKMAGVLG